jgi:hypothetical protein
MDYFKQTKKCSWLNTDEGTIWIKFLVNNFGYYIQPEDESLRNTSLGINLALLSEKELEIFKPLITIEIQ